VAATDAPQPTEKHPKDPENNPGANIAGASDYFRSILQMRACLSRSVCLLCHLFYCRGRRRSAKVTEIEVSLAHTHRHYRSRIIRRATFTKPLIIIIAVGLGPEITTVTYVSFCVTLLFTESGRAEVADEKISGNGQRWGRRIRIDFLMFLRIDYLYEFGYF
jgi:hypothetical protein